MHRRQKSFSLLIVFLKCLFAGHVMKLLRVLCKVKKGISGQLRVLDTYYLFMMYRPQFEDSIHIITNYLT